MRDAPSPACAASAAQMASRPWAAATWPLSNTLIRSASVRAAAPAADWNVPDRARPRETSITRSWCANRNSNMRRKSPGGGCDVRGATGLGPHLVVELARRNRDSVDEIAPADRNPLGHEMDVQPVQRLGGQVGPGVGDDRHLRPPPAADGRACRPTVPATPCRTAPRWRTVAPDRRGARAGAPARGNRRSRGARAAAPGGPPSKPRDPRPRR